MSGCRLAGNQIPHLPLGAIPAVLVGDQSGQAHPRIGPAGTQPGSGQFGADRIHHRGCGREWIGAHSGSLAEPAEPILQLPLLGDQFAQLVDGLGDLLGNGRAPVEQCLVVHSHLIVRLFEKALYNIVYNDDEVQGFCGVGEQYKLADSSVQSNVIKTSQICSSGP